jgi:hypothetical protein
VSKKTIEDEIISIIDRLKRIKGETIQIIEENDTGDFLPVFATISETVGKLTDGIDALIKMKKDEENKNESE